jgi:hypothetical protein
VLKIQIDAGSGETYVSSICRIPIRYLPTRQDLVKVLPLTNPLLEKDPPPGKDERHCCVPGDGE